MWEARRAAGNVRAWVRRAVVDFAHGPEPGGSADYTIRMSLLETPETWVSIEKFSHSTSR